MFKKCLLLYCLLLTSAVFSQITTDVFELARSGTADQAKKVLATNANAFNVINEHGFSPLILACYRGNEDVARVLIESGSDINKNSPMGTALMASAVKGNNPVAQLLLSKGANPDLADNNGTTALMYAVQFRNVELVQMLLKARASKTITDAKGRTAFEHAVFGGNEEIINLLK